MSKMCATSCYVIESAHRCYRQEENGADQEHRLIHRSLGSDPRGTPLGEQHIETSRAKHQENAVNERLDHNPSKLSREQLNSRRHCQGQFLTKVRSRTIEEQ